MHVRRHCEFAHFVVCSECFVGFGTFDNSPNERRPSALESLRVRAHLPGKLSPTLHIRTHLDKLKSRVRRIPDRTPQESSKKSLIILFSKIIPSTRVMLRIRFRPHLTKLDHTLQV
ncbi:hypothetical protein ABKN59_000817 [Abortiporus biennis]